MYITDYQNFLIFNLDIIGSTGITKNLTHEERTMFESRFDNIVDTVVKNKTRNMRIIKKTGDAFFIVGDQSLECISFFVYLNKELDLWMYSGNKISIRCGAHFDNIRLISSPPDELEGTGVSLASRCCSLSQGGTLIVTQTLYDLIKNDNRIRLFRLDVNKFPEKARDFEEVQLWQIELPAFRNYISGEPPKPIPPDTPLSTPKEDYSKDTSLFLQIIERKMRYFRFLADHFYKQSIDIETIYIERKIDKGGTFIIEKTPVDVFVENIRLDKYDKQRLFFIYSLPGMGKTMLWRRISLWMVQKYNEWGFIPLAISAHDISTEILHGHTESKSHSITRCIFNSFIEQESLDNNKLYQSFEKLINTHINEGKCFILIDALDEVPEERRDAVLYWIHSLRIRYQKIPFIVFLRPVIIKGKYSDDSLDFWLRGFEKESIEDFITKWFRNSRPHTDFLFKRKNDDAYRHLNEVFETPLYLAFACILLEQFQAKELEDKTKKAEEIISRKRLLPSIINLMLTELDSERRIRHIFDKNLKLLFLERLGYENVIKERDEFLWQDLIVFANGCASSFGIKEGFDAGLFIEEIVRRSGIIQLYRIRGVLSENAYCFSHQVFSEWFCSQYLHHNPEAINE